ncbi:hypothetical protein RND81_12G041100 [Saponaria officinalis]|uniref:GTD-binding domain-containing protein n=1 Tax=Saponaria officinalis TaxID=3572 RepID=A0AAW1H356_SAPOF
MARCQMMRNSWSFSGLVGAFLDLGIAYFLLCCSAIAFFISNFLAFFGLSLPCPCNGLFGYPNHGYYVQRILVDYPTKTVSNLHLSVKSKFPFDAVLARNELCQLNLKLMKERKFDNGELEFDGEVSYSSFSDPQRSQQSFSGSDSIGKFNVKGKGGTSQRPRCFSHRRRRRGSIDYWKLSLSSSLDHMKSDIRTIRRSPSDPSKIGNELNVELSKPANSHGRSSDFESIDATNEGRLMYGNATSFENLKTSARHVDGIDGEDDSTIRILEQALEEEQVARVALCSELEQERIAAATAADEAMAMISRLQEVEASIKNLRWNPILVRREMEKHFLEREVEAYRKVLQDDEGMDNQIDDVQGQDEASYLDSSVNPMLILQQLSESIDKRDGIQNNRNHPDYASASVEIQTSSGKELSNSQTVDEYKIMKVLEHPECSRLSPDQLMNTDESGKQMLEQVGEPHVLDVHVISSKRDTEKIAGKGSGPMLMLNDASGFPRKRESSVDSPKELEINRSRSDLIDKLVPIISSTSRGPASDLRRNSLPTLDHERLKIDTEVEWLRARLKAVQEEKEKLKSSLDCQERGKAEFQLLEAIADQIREIRHLTQPEKTARQGSLPPLSSKNFSIYMKKHQTCTFLKSLASYLMVEVIGFKLVHVRSHWLQIVIIFSNSERITASIGA